MLTRAHKCLALFPDLLLRRLSVAESLQESYWSLIVLALTHVCLHAVCDVLYRVSCAVECVVCVGYRTMGGSVGARFIKAVE